MVAVISTEKFQRSFSKIKYGSLRHRVLKQIEKLRERPTLGKPMMYARKGTRELYISPFRLSYAYENGKVLLLDLYHKDEQ